MPRTIINGNGWYLFGISDDQEIQKVVSSTNPNNELSDYIVANHSADVEYAYVVQKHNPVRAWIKKDSNNYEVYTNSLLGNGEKFSVKWEDGDNDGADMPSNDNISTVDTEMGYLNLDFTAPSSSFDSQYGNDLKVTVTKSG